MSFNFGPTLLSWLKEKNAGHLRGIIEADKKSQERFSATARRSRRSTIT